jgi:hypothetical protein
MTPDKCPNCGTKLRREMLHCPNCPMSFPEDDPSARVHPLKQSKYYQFVLPALFFVGLGYLIWSIGIGLFRLGSESADGDVSGMLHGGTPTVSNPTAAQKNAAMGVVESTEEAKAAEEPKSPEPEAPAETGETMVIAHGDSAPLPPPPPARVEAPAPTPKPAREWRLRGTVYDLVSLQPLPFTTVLLVDQELNRRIETRTDSSGAYRTVVPSLPDRGYTVQLQKDGYSPTYLSPETEGVRRMPLEKRRALARDLAATFTSEPATLQAPDAKPVRTDFYLAPRP